MGSIELRVTVLNCEGSYARSLSVQKSTKTKTEEEIEKHKDKNKNNIRGEQFSK